MVWIATGFKGIKGKSPGSREGEIGRSGLSERQKPPTRSSTSLLGFSSPRKVAGLGFVENHLSTYRSKQMAQTAKGRLLKGPFVNQYVGTLPSTLPETNIAPENRPLEKEIPIGNHHF